ncbi:chromaffin granule amine transporter isoform X2 [Xenopus laevis]|uniref:Chromaffin granule amine transporter isoform X2 n=1 Tax=Xenopus laevis TaxID=8355 RepID=A0A8J1MSP1_XENLA|nr:chromaffin granule amine transporter isoform X2 [Xenopus laevis]
MAGCSPCQSLKEKCKSRGLILFVITVVMFVDCILFSIVAPIAPAILFDTEFGIENTTITFHNASSSSSVLLSNHSINENSIKEPYHDQIINSTESTGNQTDCYQAKEYLNEENVRVGLLLAIKAILQLVTNPIVGKLINRTGYDAPLFWGTIIMFFSTIMFAFTSSYAFLCVARGLQGIGSSFTTVSAGPPFGSTMYEFIGKSSPFLVIAGLALLDGALQLFILQPKKLTPISVPATPYRNLLMDPYILVAAVALCICNLSYGILETTLPIRMMETMCAPRYQLGLSLLPCVVAYLICLNAFAGFSLKIGRWLCILLGIIIQGISVMLMPLALNIYGLIGPSAALGIGFGLMETSVMPLMAQLVDLRHTSNYGGIYAISDIALCIGYALGPSCGGAIAKVVEFEWLMIILGIINLVFAPVLILLRNPPGKEETKPVLSQEGKQDS